MLIKSGKGRDSKKDLGQLSMLAPICKQAQTLQTSDPFSLSHRDHRRVANLIRSSKSGSD